MEFIFPATLSFLSMLCLALLTWVVGTIKRNVSIVDITWGLFFLIGTCIYSYCLEEKGFRVYWLPILIALWSLRLSGHIAWRNHGHGEDRRYQEIRNRNQLNFQWKSLYLVFGLQAILAFIISTPLLAALSSRQQIGWLDFIGIAIWLLGWLFEVIGDAQLLKFKSQKNKHANQQKVLDTGLWRYTRHPNYFGECCLWWGFYLIALSSGGWWTIFSPLIMSFLLLKVSGVALLEKGMVERNPNYQDYIANTNAFFPGPPRNRKNIPAA